METTVLLGITQWVLRALPGTPARRPTNPLRSETVESRVQGLGFRVFRV